MPVVHELPVSSGKIVEETFVYSPPGWSCATNCYSFNAHRYVTTYDIGYQGLVKLEAQNPYYKQVNGAPNHSFEENYYGLPTTLETLKLIAEHYFILAEKKLSINDMSLRKGGLYDIFGNWQPAHSTHREGKDVDINRDDVDCKDDRNFFIATDMLLPPVRAEEFNPFNKDEPSAINCESSGTKKHIDFEIDFDDFIGQGSFY